ncbi:atlastin-3-like, partial [Trichogramma pretiosum]|uniref:atlastin-3-like n=1 Tax=Trichogramma pretiosum TaxID=7493 RepID=UPI000C71B03A
AIPSLKEYMREILDISCFLMPHPGSQIYESNGQTGLLRDVYKKHLNQLFSMLFAQDKLVIKEYNGAAITAGELLQYFRTYTSNFQTSPSVQNLFEATVRANNLIEIERSLKLYKNLMRERFENGQSYAPRDQLKKGHEDCFHSTLQYFISTKRMGGNRYGDRYREHLKQKLQKEFQEYIVIYELQYYTLWQSIKNNFNKLYLWVTS